ncbi:hypothetical protein C1H46_039442 [Malus baccata]|uniref:Uncharacterized protein n=1 Tax=Malus baccata TaxID=106549 RepID=A0A540KLC8_MALBA|nr:hypothetical protein C1H46_039442 [Malus baccata]
MDTGAERLLIEQWAKKTLLMARSLSASSKDINTFMFMQGMLKGNGLVTFTVAEDGETIKQVALLFDLQGQSKFDPVMDSSALGKGVLDRAAAPSSLCSRPIG